MNIQAKQPNAMDAMTVTALRSTRAMLSLPFDMARTTYAASVKAGLLADSMLACAHVARDLGRSEQLTLGPWARQR